LLPRYASGAHHPSATVLANLRSLEFNLYEEPELAIIVDARGLTATAAQTLSVIADRQEVLHPEVIVLVDAGSEIAVAGARRLVADAGGAFLYLDQAVSQSRAKYFAVIDADTEIDADTLSIGLATLTGSAEIAVVCGIRIDSSGTVVDAGLQLDPDGVLSRRGAGVAPDHHTIASVSEVNLCPPAWLQFPDRRGAQ
jgi:hypothetical protein